MSNNNIRYAIEYHEATKHSELSLNISRHYLDWDNKPRPFKVYTRLPYIYLTKEFTTPQLDALTAISSIEPPNRSTSFNLKTLAQILFFSAGLTREIKYPFGTYFMRAASATGALYPIELYLVCQDIENLKAGVYHFGAADFSLTQLREGDYRHGLALATANYNDIASAPCTIVFTSLAWRNAWKYQARSYRHWFWDSGVIAANLLATALSANLPVRLVMGFIDEQVNRLLGLERHKEATIALAPVGMEASNLIDSRPKTIPQIKPEFLPLSNSEVEYPEIWSMHDASNLTSKDEVDAWVKTAGNFRPEPPAIAGVSYPIKFSGTSQTSLGEAILKRGSTRRFAKKPISLEQLSTILYSSTRGIPADFLGENNSNIDVFFIVSAVDGLQSGAYYLNRTTTELVHLKSGEFRTIAGYLCLGQPLFSNASVVLYLMVGLDAILSNLGNRGYSVAQFEAGIIAGKIYLSAYALGIGASGSTFFDDAVTKFFSPYAEDRSTMIAVGIGVPDYKARPGKILAGRFTREELLQETL